MYSFILICISNFDFSDYVYILEYRFIVFIIIGAALFFYFIIKKRKQPSNINLHGFIDVFTHFRVSLDSDANVFQALTETLKSTNGDLYALLEDLVNSLAQDHSITPFMNFARPFNNRLVTQIMINIYMLINHGLDHKRLWQFNYMFETLIREFNEEQIALHESSYERFNMTIFLGTGTLIFALMASIFSLIGGF